MSVNDWYSLFLANRPVEMKRNVSRGKKTTCYSMYISKLKTSQVTENLRYQISSFLYDPKTSQMFGRQCRTEWKPAESNGTCVFNEKLYFYSEIVDRDLLLIIEFVEQGNNHITPDTSIGWFSTLVEKKRAVEISENRSFEIFGGTPNLLIFDKDVVLKPVGNVECSYTIHETAPFFFKCIPEFCIVCERDIIPGIMKDGSDDFWLSIPKEMPTIPAAIDAIVIQFKNNVPELERQISSDIEREWALKEGGDVKQTAVIMDRKLRVGVHNGYTYVTEPITVDLEVMNMSAGGTLRSRKKPLDLRRTSSYGEEIVFQSYLNPRIALQNLYADPRMAIIFLLEYTFHREDNQSLNQKILIGWAAWTPFSDGVFSGKEVETRVSIVGGPRPNPEGVLCYKNVLNQPDSVKPLSEKLEIFVDFKFYENGQSAHNTPTPRRSNSARTSVTAKTAENVQSGRSNKKNVKVESPKAPEVPSRFPALVDTGRSSSSLDELRSINEALDRFIEEPMEIPVEEFVLTKRPVEEPLPLTTVYKIPFEEMKSTNFPRSVHSLFARMDFVQLKDRNGDNPSTDDITQKIMTDMTREKLDRLDTAHVYFQFVAFKQLASPDAVILKKAFFTINFYRFPEITTESMLLSTMEKGEPNLLRRIDSNGVADNTSPPGFIAKYIIEGEESKLEFLEFLSSGHACIDVWDADSLIHYGSTIVPLRNLYRRGREAVQSFIQCPIVDTSLDMSTKPSAFLYMRIANIGYPSGNDPSFSSMATTRSNVNNGTVVRRFTSSIRLNEEGPHSYRVHAKPLPGNSGVGLDRFLSAQRLDIQQRHDQLFNENSLEKIREWQDLKEGFQLTDDKDVTQKFIFEEELAAYKKLRYESKPAKLLEAVFKGITTCHQINPSFGEKVFFEFPLENIHNQPLNCTIEYDDIALRPVLDDEEWAFFKTVNKLKTPLEKNMMRETSESIDICLQPNDVVFIPFIYDAFFFPSDHFNMYSTKVVFRQTVTKEPIAILDLHIHRRSVLLQHAVTFICETAGNWEKQLVLPPMTRDRRVFSCRCSDPSVRLTIRNATLQQIVGFTTYSGETNDRKTFLLLMYSDHYQTRLIATWKVTILPYFNVDVRSIVGQTLRFHLIVHRRR
ncbi:unnamed protein product [Caenorhabditis brenneri]